MASLLSCCCVKWL